MSQDTSQMLVRGAEEIPCMENWGSGSISSLLFVLFSVINE